MHLSDTGADSALPTFIDFANLTEQALQNIYDGFDGLVEPNLFTLTTAALYDAVQQGFGQIAYGAPNFEFTRKLRESGAWFSANKSYVQFTELAKLLDNGKGSRRSWTEFRQLAEPIVGKYNQTWLKAEYNTAIRSARIASKWKDIEATADLYPNIEFVRTRSAEPRPDHLEYVGIVRPINDPFWDTHTPPMGFNCKCSIRPTDASVTPIPKGLSKPSKGLKNNPGKTGDLFSADHPYFQKDKTTQVKLKGALGEALAFLDSYLSNHNLDL